MTGDQSRPGPRGGRAAAAEASGKAPRWHAERAPREHIGERRPAAVVRAVLTCIQRVRPATPTMRAAVIASLLLASSPPTATAAPTATRRVTKARKDAPNLFLVMCDDLDKKLGGEGAIPQVHKLLGEGGADAANYFVSSPKCTPSRAAWLSGRHYHNLRPNGAKVGVSCCPLPLYRPLFFTSTFVCSAHPRCPTCPRLCSAWSEYIQLLRRGCGIPNSAQSGLSDSHLR
jgi:hypothetical protein